MSQQDKATKVAPSNSKRTTGQATQAKQSASAKQPSQAQPKQAQRLEPGMIPVTGQAAHLIKANLLVLGAIFILALSNASLAWYAIAKKTEVIATTEAGAIINPVPLPQAFVTDSRVIGFVDECVRASLSHDYENYRRSINALKTCYTSDGSASFEAAFEPLLKDIISKRVVISATTEPPIIMRGPYLSYGRATWEVQSVVTIYFQGTKETFTPLTRLATIKVVRVPLAENYRGVSMEAIQLAPYSRSR